MSRKIPIAIQRKPIRYAMAYLWGTYGLFLIGGLEPKGVGLFVLTLFVFGAFSALYFGYRLGIGTRRSKIYEEVNVQAIRRKKLNLACIFGALYFAAFGLNMLHDFGFRGPGDVIDAILHPGASYKAKFEVFADRLQYGSVNRITQLLIIFSIFYALLIPVLVCYWNLIQKWVRTLALVSVLLYVIAFLAIGTMKGVGDILLLSLAGVSVLLGSGLVVLSRKQKRRSAVGILLLFLAVGAYMVANQSSRSYEFNKTGSIIVDDVSDTVLADLVGESWAYGIYAMLAYPSHGYAGLSLDLQQDFVFSHGAGISPALESYRRQYLGGEDYSWLTYPARTEAVTGWPAGRVWSTAFPWFASDLTFPGTIAFMILVGFVFARVWINCIAHGGVLEITALGQIFIFIAFLPANNQVFMQRQGLWILASLIGLWALKAIGRVRR